MCSINRRHGRRLRIGSGGGSRPGTSPDWNCLNNTCLPASFHTLSLGPGTFQGTWFATWDATTCQSTEIEARPCLQTPVFHKLHLKKTTPPRNPGHQFRLTVHADILIQSAASFRLQRHTESGASPQSEGFSPTLKDKTEFTTTQLSW